MQSLVSLMQQLKQSGAQSSSVNLHKVIADNIFNDLRSHGMREKDIIAVSSELIAKLTTELQASK